MKTSSKRQDILDCAARLFNHHGFKAIGIDRIIAESKIAKMTLYHHFASKDEIIVEVLAGFNQHLEHGILGPLASKKLSPEKKLKELINLYDQWFKSEAFHGCPFHKAVAEFPEKDHPVQGEIKKHHDLLDNFLTETVCSKKLAGQILLVLEGSIIQAKLSAKTSTAKDAWAIISRLLKT